MQIDVRNRPVDLDGVALVRLEAGGEMEDAALAQLALHPDPPIHHRHQALRDREPETAAAVLPGGRSVGLGEVGENRFGQFGSDSDSRIGNRKVQEAGVARLETDAGRDRPAFGEFDGVADQIDQDLADSQRIADQLGRRLR